MASNRLKTLGEGWTEIPVPADRTADAMYRKEFDNGGICEVSRYGKEWVIANILPHGGRYVNSYPSFKQLIANL